MILLTRIKNYIILKNSMNKKGFTMIELLIVIGVLGILATGVLAAVDPFEQLKKARDTNTRQSVISLHTAFIRYYATHANLPWDMPIKPEGCDELEGGARPLAAGVDTADTCIASSLEADGELKPGFVKALGSGVASTIFITSGAKAQLYICFMPQSKPVFAEEGTRFSQSGVDMSATECSLDEKKDGPAGGAECYYCAK